MFVLTVGALALLGGTTWLALQESVAADPDRHHRLTATGLLLCLLTGLAAVAAAMLI
ncbi:hypothetical protein [Actinoplanes derwentensis]|uniref:Uncharacterized protein n=1 Tax=Actinoplanes derwentensis TaxID=113562 RepID=A0A1H1SYL6_9ACTN|nr:hypothetical protein [Actinoplanes derwentensis]GID90075.1 hypothetical protein Ade03nite_89990 [Actinoplanes derwentensis]SDS52988.1 hypothetical protein SAMN04489716_0986 [Actinoplanes derwentensis]